MNTPTPLKVSFVGGENVSLREFENPMYATSMNTFNQYDTCIAKEAPKYPRLVLKTNNQQRGMCNSNVSIEDQSIGIIRL
jgi:hypothetical protein